WSDMKRSLFYHHGFSFLMSFLALVTLFGVLLWLQRKRLPGGVLPAGLCLIGAAFTELCVATLCESTEMTRHSTIFFALFDLIALVCVTLAITSVTPRAVRGALAGRFRSPGAAATGDVPDRTGRQAQAPAPIPQPVPAPVFAPTSPPASAPDMRRVDGCLYAAGALLLAVYFFRLTRASLQVYFTPNDLMNLYQSWIFSPGLLVKSNLLFFLAYDYVRPMGDAWYRAIVHFAGFHPFWFHASDLAILAANIWLTFAVARRLASREIAALTALGMAYQLRLGWLYFDTGFIYDVLCYFFLFAAMALYLRVRARAAELRAWHWAALFALYICAMNSKEMAVMLPAFLGTYELLYHPPRAWQPATLYRWLLREGRSMLATGAVAVLFLAGRSIGTQGLINLPAYRPSPTWTRFMLTSRHFAGDILGMPDWPAWAVLLLWTALAAIAWFTRSRALRFAWLFLMLSPLPIAFILPRDSPQYYVCVFGWMLYAAVLLVTLGSLLTRGVPLAEWWLSRARGAALFIVSMAILYAAYKPLGYAVVYCASVEAPQNRDTVAQLHAAAPAIRPGSRLLFLNDPIPADSYHLLFMVRLSYGDRSLRVFRAKEMQQPPNDKEIASYDYVLDYRDGRFFELKEPGPAR
ncbi:MAG: hypothetical protein WBL61_26140, partial [Bryobacteraceae bacterium]